MRLGISTGQEAANLKDYVLREIPDKYSEVADDMLNRAAEAALCFIREGINQAMSRYNVFTQAEIEE